MSRRSYDEKRTFPYRQWLYLAWRSPTTVQHVHAQSFVTRGSQTHLVACCSPNDGLDVLRKIKHRSSRRKPLRCPGCVRILKAHGLL